MFIIVAYREAGSLLGSTERQAHSSIKGTGLERRVSVESFKQEMPGSGATVDISCPCCPHSHID